MEKPLNLEVFVSASDVFCQLSRIPYDATLFIKKFPRHYDWASFQQALLSPVFNNNLKRYSSDQLLAVR